MKATPIRTEPKTTVNGPTFRVACASQTSGIPQQAAAVRPSRTVSSMRSRGLERGPLRPADDELDLVENGRVVDRRRDTVLTPGGDCTHRPAQDLPGARLGQTLDDPS